MLEYKHMNDERKIAYRLTKDRMLKEWPSIKSSNIGAYSKICSSAKCVDTDGEPRCSQAPAKCFRSPQN